MKTAEEIADELVVYSRRDSVGAVALKDAIEQALTAFAEERVKEAYGPSILEHVRSARAEGWAEAIKRLDGIKLEGIEIGRAEALEEAAKKAEGMGDFGVADAIRALKDK